MGLVGETRTYLGAAVLDLERFSGPLVRLTISSVGIRFDTRRFLFVGRMVPYRDLAWAEIEHVVRATGRDRWAVGRGIRFVRKVDERWGRGRILFNPVPRSRPQIHLILSDIRRLGPPGIVADDDSSGAFSQDDP